MVEPSPEIAVRRAPERGVYDLDSVRAVLEAALIVHVGTVRDGRPVVIPMFHAIDGDHLLLHGAPAAGTVRRSRGEAVCVTATVVDALVLARSALHHSMNYRSVVVLGEALELEDGADKRAALDRFVERLTPGRAGTLRPTNAKEARRTSVLRVSLDEASVKIRAGGPVDDPEDLGHSAWAGVVPVRSVFGEPQAADDVPSTTEVPRHVLALTGRPA